MASPLTTKLDFWVKHNKNVLFIGKHGVGKCLGKGTPVMKADGKIIPVELVREGDFLMGPDSLPRRVLGVTNGKDRLYRVTPVKGDSFVCNEPHVLTLSMAGSDELFDMPLDQFLKTNPTFQKRAMLVRAGVEFSSKKLDEAPYMLGLWLGDGVSRGSGFTATEEEILGYLCDYANKYQMRLVPTFKESIDYRLSASPTPNRFLSFLKKYDLIKNKHIPHDYLTSNREDRLQLLAGIIDTDGEMVHNCMSVTQKSHRLSQDILFLARSLGFAAYAKKCQKSWRYKGVKKVGTYYRITISGHTDEIPCQLNRKKANPRRQEKNVRHVGIKSIEFVEEGEYFGFTLDGDGRFLLGDFTVTHNTMMVQETFDRHKLKWRYFSASTMDPWVDFVGVPKEKSDGNIPACYEVIRELAKIDDALAYEWVEKNWHLTGASAKKIVDHATKLVQGPTYLDLVRPQDFATGEVEALFFDEFNRSPKKVRNAVMELLQFKRINGKEYPNLKIVWAAINPDDDEDETYDVERLDPAQQDRYHVTVEVPYKPNADWFKSRYGQRQAEAALHWWDDLPDEEKKRVSPRRLQYALDIYRERGDMRDVLPVTSNVTKLSTALNTGPITEKLEALMAANDAAESRNFLQNENNFAAAMKFIPKVETLMNYFMPLISKEKLGVLMNDDDKTCNYIIGNSNRIPVFQEVCKEILHANTNVRLAKKIRRVLTENQDLAMAFAPGGSSANTPADSHFNKGENKSWGTSLSQLKASPKTTPAQRLTVYEKVVEKIPEKMTADEALNTLSLLNDLFGNDGWSSTVSAKPFEKLMGVVNHCIKEVHRNTGLDWTNILTKHGNHFKSLLEKIKEGGLASRLYTPN